MELLKRLKKVGIVRKLVENWTEIDRKLVENWTEETERKLIENWSKPGRKLTEIWSKSGRKLIEIIETWSKTDRKLIENWSKPGRKLIGNESENCRKQGIATACQQFQKSRYVEKTSLFHITMHWHDSVFVGQWLSGVHCPAAKLLKCLKSRFVEVVEKRQKAAASCVVVFQLVGNVSGFKNCHLSPCY